MCEHICAIVTRMEKKEWLIYGQPTAFQAETARTFSYNKEVQLDS